jgi:hypothetical protein
MSGRMAVRGGRDPALGFGFEDGDEDVASPSVSGVAMSSSPWGSGFENGDGDVASPFAMGGPLMRPQGSTLTGIPTQTIWRR